jgi:hypothetical protein
MKVFLDLFPIFCFYRSMNKQAEIQIIEEAINKLGEDSYLGPWLAEIKLELESMIKCDFLPEISLKGTAERIAKKYELANNERNQMIANARTEAESIVKYARAEANRTKDAAHNALTQAIRQLEK